MKPGAYIAIEGPIGVGKSTLTARLALSLNARVLPEMPDANPFLGAFYDNPRGHALSAQLFFLLQRARQIDALRQTDMFDSGCVADFMFEKDPLFARLTLSGPELALYEDIYARLAWQAPTPEQVIYLHAPVDVLMARVEQRDRKAEQGLTRDYMVSVVAAYQQFFADYDAAHVIRVDADALDLVHCEADYQRLLSALQDDAGVTDIGKR